jgi:hypothetical protein
VAIVFDAASEFERTGTTDPQTWTHTPTGTPRAVVVAIVHGTSTTDHVSTVTYGGVSMGEVVRATDSATELGAAELWFLGAGIPTGAQTVSVDLASGTTDDIHFVCMTWTAGANCEVIDFDSINSGDPANPSVTLQYGGRSSVAVAALYGGGASPAQFTPNANCTTVHDNDLGAFYSEVIRQTSAGTADFAVGGTAGSDDVAYAALAFSEFVGITASAGVGVLTATGFAPTVTTTNNVTVTAGVGALVFDQSNAQPTIAVGADVVYLNSFTAADGTAPTAVTPELATAPLQLTDQSGIAPTIQGGAISSGLGAMEYVLEAYTNGVEYDVTMDVRTRSGGTGTGTLSEIGREGSFALVWWTTGDGFVLYYGIFGAPESQALGWGFGETHRVGLTVTGTTGRVFVDGAEIDSWTLTSTGAPWSVYLLLYNEDTDSQLAAEVLSLAVIPTGTAAILTEPGALTATGFAPTVSATANQTVTAGLGEATLTGFAPTVTATNHQTVAAGLGALVATGYEPTVSASNHQSVTAGVGALTVEGFAPTVSAGAHVTVTAGLGALVATGFEPTVSATAHVSVTAGVGALTATGFSPTVSATNHQTVAAGLGELAVTGFSPTVSATAHVTASAGLGELTATGHAPSVTVGDAVEVVPGTGVAVLSGFSPTVSASDHQTVTPGCGIAELIGFEPTVSVTSGGSATAEPGTGIVIVAGYAPTISTTAHVTVSPGTGLLILTGHAPNEPLPPGGPILWSLLGSGVVSITGSSSVRILNTPVTVEVL